MVQPAPISASAPNTNLLITPLHATAATNPGRDTGLVTELDFFPVRFIESFKLKGC
jgi:hypothetical protein